MKKLFLLALLFVSLYAKAQEPEIGVMPDAPKIECNFDKYLAAPYYFDKEMANIVRGTIKEIEYKSFTVGTTRKATIYLPPNYSKKKNEVQEMESYKKIQRKEQKKQVKGKGKK